MTSQLNVDTIVDKAGTSGPSLPNTTTIKMGNTSTYVSDGGNVTQNTVQGISKAWAINDHTATSVSDSFNQSSITDISTGTLTWDVTNNFASVNWTAAANTTADNATNDVSMVHSGTRTTNNTATDKDTTGTSWYAKNSSHSGYDSKLSGYIAQGDLA